MEKSLDYGSIMNTAMKGFVRDVLAIVAKDGCQESIISLSRLTQRTLILKWPIG